MRGQCTCGEIVYELADTPLFVHACHCRSCQRETGSAFALNLLIETDRVRLVSGTPDIVDTPSASGRGQKIARCPNCRVAVWSTYFSPKLRFVRVGTLDNPDACPPDIHIYTQSKQPWVQIPDGAATAAQFYDMDALWPAESLARRDALKS